MNESVYGERRNILYSMSHGKLRREAIIDHLRNSEYKMIYINRKHQIQLHEDNDLKYLIKRKILKQIRIKSSRNHGYTVLVLNGE